MNLLNTTSRYILFFFIIPLSIYAQKDEIPLKEANVSGKKKQRQSIKYEKLKNMPEFGVYSFGTAIENDKLYVMSGDVSNTGMRTEYKGFNDRIYVYDLKNDFWKTLKTKSSTIANNSIISHNGLLYSFGGRRYGNNRNRELLNNVIDVYDIKKDSMMIDSVMVHQAVNSPIVKVDDKVLFFGGSIKKFNDNTKFFTDKVSMYNLTTGYCYEMDPMPESKEAPGILVDNKIYLIGGNKNQPLNSIDSYNLKDGKWTKEFELPKKMLRPSLTKKGRIIYIYEDGIFYTYDTYDKILKEYTINDILAINGEIFIYNDYMYILGGIINDKETNNQLLRFSLNEFNHTKVRKELTINKN